MFQISRSTPAYYFTSVTHKRLPIFSTDGLKQVICDAYREACDRHEIAMLAYVIMPDHSHLLTYSEKKIARVLQLLNGVAAKRIIDHLKENGYERSLFKLRGEARDRNHRHSVWHHHPDSLEIVGEDTFSQKVEYIHQNPLRAGLVSNPLDYRFSSARLWAGRPFNDQAPSDRLEEGGVAAGGFGDLAEKRSFSARRIMLTLRSDVISAGIPAGGRRNRR